MRRIILALCTTISMYALTPLDRAHIQQLIKEIKTGKMRLEEVFKRVEALKISNNEENTPIVQELRNLVENLNS